MAHLIDKDAVVAEIKRRIKEHHSGYLVCLKDILSYLDTLEVKEVDLNEEIEECLRQYHMIAVGRKEFEPIAKYFFELGLKAQKGE